MRPLAVGAATVCLLLQACGGDPSLPEYAEEVEALVTTMNARIDEMAALIEQSEDLEEVKWAATERVAARYVFLDDFAALEPPGEAAELHAAALEIMGRLADAESELAELVQGLEALGEIDVWETPEGQAARAADERAIALCKAAEEEFDTSEQGQGLQGVPWIPPEMRVVIQVAFGCEAADR